MKRPIYISVNGNTGVYTGNAAQAYVIETQADAEERLRKARAKILVRVVIGWIILLIILPLLITLAFLVLR